MKDQHIKEDFIRLRAGNMSYRAIAEKLQISKSTCGEWERQLKEQIAAARAEREQELIEQYGMGREARIQRLSKELHNIQDALSNKILAQLSADKLLKLMLEYEKALRAEYRTPGAAENVEPTTEGILKAYSDLYNESKAGEISPAQVKSRIEILKSMQAAQIALDNDRLLD